VRRFFALALLLSAPALAGDGDAGDDEMSGMRFDTLPVPPPARDESHPIGRAYSRLFFARDVDALWQNFSPAVKKQFGSPDGFKSFIERVASQFGDEKRVMNELEYMQRGNTNYVRISQFTRYARGVELEWTWDDEAIITGVSFHPSKLEAPTTYLSYRTKTPLRLPFDDAWTVLWGGRTVEVNRHATVADERFAYDLFIQRGSTTYAADGRRLDQYYCFGRPVVAPGAGTIISVVEDIPDNIPGTINPDQLFGNHVVIDHGNGEYSLLAHLMKGSVAVQAGQKVRSGDFLARTGNSGTSTEPHLHYQMMDAADYVHAHGMPAQFIGYVADGRFVARGEPVHGQVIEHRAPKK
jgi:hypothetical protein